MSKIYNLSLKYRLVRQYVNWAFRNYYSEYIVLGRENLPKEGPMIFAPNHRNALMDALAVTSIGDKDYSVSFLARSDIFKNKTLAKLLHAAKIMPAFRSRDGVENLGKNAAIFEQCTDLLLHKHALCIMPEGNQALDQKIRQLVKGIFRIAFSTQEKLPKQAIKIIPIGIDYGDIVKARKHIIINIGAPIDVSEYMSLYAENQPLAINEIRSKLTDELRKLTIDINSKENHDSFKTVLDLIGKPALEPMGWKVTTTNTFIAKQEITKKLAEIEERDLVKTESIVAKANLCAAKLKCLNLKPGVLDSHAANFKMLIAEGLLLVASLPVFVLGLVVNALPFFLPVVIRKYLIKPKFSGFFSSIQFAMALLTFPLLYGIQAVMIASFSQLSFWTVMFIIPLQFVVGNWALLWYRKTVKYLARIRYYKLSNQGSDLLSQAILLRKQLREEVG